MSLLYPVRVKQTTSTTGTGTLTLLSAAGETRSFQSHYGSGPVKVTYVIQGTGYFEWGIGTFTSPSTLTRDTVMASSNANALVSLPSATADVFVDWPAGSGVDQFTTAITLSVSENGNVKEFTGSVARNLTLPALSSLPRDGFEVGVENDGTAAVSLVPNGTDTINGGAAGASLLLQPGQCGLLYKGATEWKYRYFASKTASLDAALALALNPHCSIAAAAGTTGTFAADAVVLTNGLTGAGIRLSPYSRVLDVSTTGAGGMDTGSAPISGFIAVYAIAQADGTKSVLACNVTTSASETYGGANMPSGYIYSCLLAIWPTDASRKLAIGVLDGRDVSIAPVSVLASGAATSITSFSISAAAPPTAKRVRGYVGFTSGTANIELSASNASPGGIGRVYFSGSGSSPGAPTTSFEIAVITSQTLWYSIVGRSGAETVSASVSGYRF